MGALPPPARQLHPLPMDYVCLLEAFVTSLGLTVEVWPQAPPGVGVNDWAVDLHSSQRSLFLSVVFPGSEHVRLEAYGQFYGHVMGPRPLIPPVSPPASLPLATPALVPASSGPIPSAPLGSLGLSPFALPPLPSSLSESSSQGLGRGPHTLLPCPALAMGGASSPSTYCGLPFPVPVGVTSQLPSAASRFGSSLSAVQTPQVGAGDLVPPARCVAFGWGPTYHPLAAHPGPYSA